MGLYSIVLRLLPQTVILAIVCAWPLTLEAPLRPVPAANLAARHAPVKIRKRIRDGASTSENWSGYVVTGTSGSVTDVVGSWIVPTVNCSGAQNTFSSFWVGIDGFNSNTVEQTGTEADCSNGAATYYAWYEFFPQPTTVITSLPVSPGDVVSAEVKATGNGGFTLTLNVAGNNFSTSATIDDATQSSAEWIAEAPSSDSEILPLANFGTVLFGTDSTGVLKTCYATVSGTSGSIASFGSSVDSITMTTPDGVNEAVPGALSSDGTSFAVNYTAPPMAVLNISKSHTNDFVQGQVGAQYTVTVSNEAGAQATSGTVTMTENPPSGLTVTSMTGSGWTCALTTCTRSDALAAGSSYPQITVSVNVATPVSTPQVNRVNVTGGGSAEAAASDSTNIDTPITFQTSPPGFQLSVDNVMLGVVPTVNLTQGPHTISAASPQTGASGTQYVFSSWSDGGAISHTITVGPLPATYTASFETQYQLTISASPGAGGNVQPASGGFYAAGSVVGITAAANSGYLFNNWSGPAAVANSESTSVTMSGPIAVVANFAVATKTSKSKVGIFRSGFYWLLDVDGNQQWDSPPDQAFPYGGIPGDVPITGDWTGDGHTKVGIYRSKNGLWLLNTNGDDASSTVYNFLQSLGGPQPGDVPVVGDWSGSGTTKIGIFRAGFEWILDYNGDGVFDQGDVVYDFGGVAGDIPVVGDWTGTGTSKIGVMRGGFFWILDANGDGTFDAGDYAFPFGGLAGDKPVVGDWTGDGVSKVGIFRDGFFWVLDMADPGVTNSTGSAPLSAFAFGGIAGDVPMVGKWFAPPVSLTATNGGFESTVVNTQFATPLSVFVTGVDGYAVSGVTMQFAAPSSGASATFAGGVTTAVTNASGVATSPAVSANASVGGPYSVVASVLTCGSYPGCPGTATPVDFSLSNTALAATSLNARK